MRLHSYAKTKHVPTSKDLFDNEKEQLIKAFNKTTFKVGNCYTNIENLRENMIEHGLNEKDVALYAGWLIVGKVPIHHAWLVYKNDYLFDGGASGVDLELSGRAEEQRITNKEELRNLYAKLLRESEEMNNSQVKTCDKAMPHYLYIGSPHEPKDAAPTFSELMQKYPEHPSYAREGMNSKGASKLQRKIMDNSK